jgi:toxin ParE1/3/4
VARYRLSEPAKADIALVLRTSETMYGTEARIRYRALLTAAMRRIAADPQGRATVDHGEIFEGVRSFHIRHSRSESLEAAVGEPVHVIFYRARESGLVEIVRVLHERMERKRRSQATALRSSFW